MGERLKGVKAVVTGGAGAIGLATARAFVREGGSVFVADLDRGAVDETVASLASEAEAAGVAVAGGTADVRSPGEVRALMRDAASRLDGLNALINNAGTIVRNLLVDYSEADIDLMLDVNVKGVVLCSQAAVPLIRESGGGSITSTSSQAGRRGWEYSTVYGASKAAVVGLSRAMAVELAPEIRVNSICPGHVRDIGMAWRTFEQPARPRRRRWRRSATPSPASTSPCSVFRPPTTSRPASYSLPPTRRARSPAPRSTSAAASSWTDRAGSRKG